MAPGFEVLDEGEAQTLLRHAQDEQMEALARPDAPADAGRRAGFRRRPDLDRRVRRADDAAAGERAWLLARIGDEAGPATRCARGWPRELGCAPDDTAGELDERCLPRSGIRCGGLRAAARALARGSKTRRHARRADRRVAGGVRRAGRAAAPPTREVFFTAKGEILKRLASKAAIAAMPDIEDVLRTRGRAAGRGARPHQRRGPGRAHAGAAAARPRHRRTLHAAPSSGARRSTTTT